MKCGGSKMKNGGQPNGTIVSPIYNASTRPTTMRKGGVKKYFTGGDTGDASKGIDSPTAPKSGYNNSRILTAKNGGAYKKGGSVKNAKLAALAPPKNKITRADIIAGALKNKRKKK